MSWNQASYVPADVRDVRVTAFLSRVYGWMFLGLLLTAGTAVVVASSPVLIKTLILNRGLFWIMLFAQLGLVVHQVLWDLVLFEQRLFVWRAEVQ